MLLQLALDLVDSDRALELIRETRHHVDLFEIGTPLLLREGVGSVRRVRREWPGIELLADTKIVDAGYDEAMLAFEAGANLVTVLAAASVETLRAVHRAAEGAGGRVVADLIASADPEEALRRASGAGVEVVCLHRAADSGAWQGENSGLLERLRRTAPEVSLMVAGGIGPEALPPILHLKPDIVVAGGSISRASDPGEAARRLRELIDAAEEGGGE